MAAVPNTLLNNSKRYWRLTSRSHIHRQPIVNKIESVMDFYCLFYSLFQIINLLCLTRDNRQVV